VRILHLGSGFRPWRTGGLVAYMEDLMDEQVRRGHDVTYLFSGRQYPLIGGPRLRRWRRGGITMLEIVNSPLYDHGRQPDLELSEPAVERILQRVLEQVKPDVAHVQEMAGLPSSILEVLHESRTPFVVTLQDYFLLCPTFKLIDSTGSVCLRREIGADCVATVAADPRPAGLMVEATLLHDLERLPIVRGRLQPRIVALSKALGRAEAARRRRRGRRNDYLPPAFQRRRDVNVERLGRADRVVAMSSRLAEIYEELGVNGTRIEHIQLTLGHIERLRGRPSRTLHADSPPLTFGTLAGFESVPKGGPLLLDALRRLRTGASAGRFRLLVFGHIERRFAAAAEALPEVELRGAYRPGDLDAMLDEVDVGVVPSVWEEAYGFAGMEFLAKGIPVIANEIGGMTDYTRDGETGWLNHSCSGAELARIVEGLIEQPRKVAELGEKVLAARSSIVKPLARHADEMEHVYMAATGNASGR
jgi:glycosyltransferase involved in cell wall biosynthesis